MSEGRGVRSLSTQSWIDLDQALAWICFDEALTLRELEAGAAKAMGLSSEKLHQVFETAWRELANHAAVHGYQIRARSQRLRITERRRLLMSADDLFDCQYIDFILRPSGRTILLSRHDRDEEGVWNTITDEEGSDFVEPVIRRSDLLSFKRAARPKLVVKKASAAAALRARKHLELRLRNMPRESVRRGVLCEEMRAKFGITQATAVQIWKEVTRDRPELNRPGRRKSIQT